MFSFRARALGRGSGGIEAVICWMALGLRYERAGRGKTVMAGPGSRAFKEGKMMNLCPIT